ncbi:MAG TPA: amidohydrolase family protein [Candidatus Udaeobacter sp.]|nr:amidohydrolase family protein [Candidatus Udaeobacter sp.]
MRKRALVRLFLLLIALVLNSFAGANAAKPKVVNDGTVIQNVTVISPERSAPLAHAVVVVRDGRIAEVGTDLVAGAHAKQIDGRGGFLIPGLTDSHVHVGNMGPLDDDAIEKHPDLLQAYHAQLPRSYLAFGFTTLVDLDLREKTLDWFNATPVHPNLCHCGRGVHVVGGYGALQTPKDAASAAAANIVYEPDQAKDWPSNLDPKDYTPARAVDRVGNAGAICLKVFVEPGFGGAAHWPVPQPATLAALRAEASRRGLVLVVHANAIESWRAALDARADVIAHGLWHWPGKQLDPTQPRETREVIKAAANAHVGVQPTLQAVYGDLSIFDKSLLHDPRLKESLPGVLVAYLNSDEGKAAQAAVATEYRQAIAKFFGSDSIDPLKAMSIGPQRASTTLRMMVAENVKLLFGTDTPSNQGIGNPPGLNGRLELGRWVEAGVPLQEVLRAATLDNAVAFRLSDRGTIQPGRRADLLLLRENPLKSVAAYDSIDSIFLNGELLPRTSLLPEK